VNRSDGAKGGRPPYDAVLMFKILILQTLYTLSDDAAEFQIRDRFSFMRFLGLELHDAVPDAKTIWLFREQLTKAGTVDELFSSFDAHLKAQGYLAMSGQIVDSTIVAAPRQRNTEDEKKAIKEERIPEDWKDKPKKLAQKDRYARWALKRAKARPTGDDGKPRDRHPSAIACRDCSARLRLQEPRLDRLRARLRATLRGDQRRRSRRGAASRGSRHEQHGQPSLGGLGIPFEGE
jgi:IS5 family transposase